MARIHSHRHGKSHQTRPTGRNAPAWVETKPEEARATILKLAKEGMSPSKIGLALRDDYGVPLAKPLLDKSIGEVLAEGKLAPKFPQDLQDLVDRAARVKNHLETHKGDRKNVHSLELVEAKIYRLSKYYRERGILPEDFKYQTVVAQLA
jgi:small subunit ribosomal protein S15